jgi:hypothetical protein
LNHHYLDGCKLNLAHLFSDFSLIRYRMEEEEARTERKGACTP